MTDERDWVEKVKADIEAGLSGRFRDLAPLAHARKRDRNPSNDQ